MKKLLFIPTLIITTLSCDSEHLPTNEGLVTLVTHKNDTLRPLFYSHEAQDQEVVFRFIHPKDSLDTVITFTYTENETGPTLMVDSTICNTDPESFNLNGIKVYKFRYSEEGVHDSEGSWYFSKEFGLVGSFGHRGPCYYYTEKNKELVKELQKKGLSF